MIDHTLVRPKRSRTPKTFNVSKHSPAAYSQEYFFRNPPTLPRDTSKSHVGESRITGVVKHLVGLNRTGVKRKEKTTSPINFPERRIKKNLISISTIVIITATYGPHHRPPGSAN